MRRSESDRKTEYIRQLFAHEDALLGEIRAKASAMGREGMMVSPEEGKLLQLLVALHRPKVIVEIGTFLGYSAIWMARALPEGGVVHSCERDPEHARLAREFVGRSEVREKITVHEGEAMASLEVIGVVHSRVDMVFVDADKGAYPRYLDWAEAHLRPGGLVVGDNTFLFGTVYGEKSEAGRWEGAWEGMREFNARLADEGRYVSLLLGTAEGMTVGVRR